MVEFDRSFDCYNLGPCYFQVVFSFSQAAHKGRSGKNGAGGDLFAANWRPKGTKYKGHLISFPTWKSTLSIEFNLVNDMHMQ